MRPGTRVVLVALAGIVALSPGGPVRGADPEIERLRKDVDEMKRDLAEIKELLRGRQSSQAAAPPAGPVAVKVDGYPVMGQAGAPITVVEFSSFQCPFCRRHFERTLPELKKAFVDEGKIRYVFHDMPLQNQPDSPNAAKAAWCAGKDGKYWQMHELLFKNQRDLSVDALKRHAGTLGLDAARFATCLDGQPAAEALEKSAMEAYALGVRGTPTFFIGPTDSGGTIRGRRLIGAQPFAAFKQVIDAELEQLKKK
ncbi:MAG TPA: thioredoxin domain-containing protein [Methylomirabilota bacterium]|jgi:protein-disulfide isomerase|nr:thioredoxin domain-containing protein [Methylomirabilota bacterium]